MALTLYGSDAKPGDLIEIFRRGYQHWAVYIGGNEVVHLTSPGGGLSSSGDMIAALNPSVGTVRRQKIGEVIDGDRFEINNLWDHKWEPRPRNVIVREACSMEDEELLYNAVTCNCEHFVTALRYGKPESRQVTQVTTAALIGGLGGAAIVGVGLVALGAALFGSLLKDDDEEDERRRREERRSRRRQW